MKKTGIFGGTFDPIHTAHLVIAKEARKQFSLDRILFMPAGAPPHKASHEIVSAKHRCNMIRAAIGGFGYFELLEHEVNRQTPSYTAETLQELTQLCPEDEFYFILGGDAFLRFENWRGAERIVRLAGILACGRSGKDNLAIRQKIDELNRKWDADIRYFEVPLMEISSHELRASIRNRKPVGDALPDAVYQYIKENKLYL